MKFSAEELSSLLAARDGIEIPAEILEFLYAMRSRYAKRAQEQLKGDEEEDEESVPYVSDRRWKKIAGILRSSALLNGREAVDWSDCLLLEHLIWDNDSQLAMVRDDLAKELVVALLKDTASAQKNDRWKKAPEEGPKRFWSPDGGLHYAFEAGGELLRISAADYSRLGPDRLNGRFGEDGVIQLCRGKGDFTICSAKPGMVTIGNFNYPLRLEGTVSAKGGRLLSEIMTSTTGRISAFKSMMDENVFTRPLVTYKTLGLELRRYQSRIESVAK